jgi:hypothetical protein
VLLGVATLLLLLCAGRLHFSREWFSVGKVVGNSLEMRQEVHYALTLMRWLELEGGRRHTAEELWLDLVFAAQRLGYVSAKMTLADGERIWERPNGGQPAHSVVEVLHAGRLGTLELKAAHCPLEAGLAQPTPGCDRSFCPCVSDGRVFEIVSELLAEGWVKGLRKSNHAVTTPLRFDTKFAGLQRRLHRNYSDSAAPASCAKPSPEPAPYPFETVR